MKNYFKAHTIGIVLIVVFSFLYTIHLGRDYLTDWDECIIVEQAKEMRETGNFFTNFWNNKPLLEKPPLNAVLTQIPFLFGVNEFNARIPMVVYGGLLVLLIYYFSFKYISTIAGIISVLLFFGNNLFSVYMRHVNTDIGFTLFSFGAFVLWYEYLIDDKKPKTFVVLSGLLCGLAVLMKGLSITPYLAAFFMTGLLIQGKKSIIPFFYLILSFFILILPWHMYQYLKYGNEFLYVYFYEHLWKRSRYPVDFHFEGRLFYIKTIFRYFHTLLIAITVPFVLLLKRLFRLVVESNYKNKKVRTDIIRKFIIENRSLLALTVMFFIPLIMITNVRTRILWYVMPIFPYIILLVVFGITFFIKKVKRYKYLVGVLLFLVIITLVIREVNLNVNVVKKARDTNDKYETFKHVKNLQYKEIGYLVPEMERLSASILSPKLKLSTTFIFGGNPCARYYTNKKIHYYYSLDDFNKSLVRKIPFMIFTTDEGKIKQINKKVLYRNNSLIVFVPEI